MLEPTKKYLPSKNMFPNIKTKCPIFLGTERENECHTKIKPKMVIDKINEAIIFTNKN